MVDRGYHDTPIVLFWTKMSPFLQTSLNPELASLAQILAYLVHSATSSLIQTQSLMMQPGKRVDFPASTQCGSSFLTVGSTATHLADLHPRLSEPTAFAHLHVLPVRHHFH